MSRYKLIPTKSARGGLFIYGSPLEALSAAQEMSDERGCPVLLVEHPLDGTIHTVTTVGDNGRKVKR